MSCHENRGRNVVVRRAAPADIDGVLKLAEGASGCARWTAAAYLPYCKPAEEKITGQSKILYVATAVMEPKDTAPALPDHSDAFPSDGLILGFAAFSALPPVGDCELDNMAVDQAWRRRGIGRRLLTGGLLWASGLLPTRLLPQRTASASKLDNEDAPSMWLEVRAGNLPAVELYRSAGFQIAGIRHDYYSQPTEDAVRMRKPLEADIRFTE
jgi:ribosomal protein S18 acetylase RimI-like enzyme